MGQSPTDSSVQPEPAERSVDMRLTVASLMWSSSAISALLGSRLIERCQERPHRRQGTLALLTAREPSDKRDSSGRGASALSCIGEFYGIMIWLHSADRRPAPLSRSVRRVLGQHCNC